MIKKKKIKKNKVGCLEPGIDFTKGADWQMFKIMAEFVEGLEFISKINNVITVFGSARLKEDDFSYQQARSLAYKLGRKKYTILTGGGGGIMQAANQGAVEAKTESVGLNIQLPFEQRINPFVRKSMAFSYFFTRKFWLTVSGHAYVFFPGGFGTMDELLEVMALVRLEILKDVPIVLVGKEFWQPFYDYIKDVLFKDFGIIKADDLKILHLVDSPDEALKILKNRKKSVLKTDFSSKGMFYSVKTQIGKSFDFANDPNWRIFRIMAEFVDGFSFIAEMNKQIAVLGSDKLSSKNKYSILAKKLAYKLGKKGFSIVTPGGKGLMEAANRGAFEAGAVSAGLDRATSEGGKMNKYVNKGIVFHYYFTRKVVLEGSSQAYVVFPGGYGTLDGFFDLITLIQTQKMVKIPVILVGKEYWQPLLNFIHRQMLPHKTISPGDEKIFTLVNDLDEAYSLIMSSKERLLF